MCCVIGSVSLLKEPDLKQFNKSDASDILNEDTAAYSAQMVFCEALRQENINFKKITVDTNKLTDGSIVISRVTVYTDQDAQKVIQLIGSDKYEVKVINE